MDPLWLDGQTINTQITPAWAREVLDGHYKELAWMVLLVELGLVVAWQVRKLAPFALVVGVGMHISIEVLDFRIGVFSYLMVAMYTLLLPEGVVRWLTSRVHVPDNPAPEWLLAVVAAVVAVGWWLLPFQGSALVAGGFLVVLVPIAAQTRASALVQLAFPALIWTAHGMSDVARDYYRYIGGDTRRRALPEEALEAYTQVTHIDPAYFSGHIRRGDLLMTLGRPGEALDAFSVAASLEPDSNELPGRIEAAEAALEIRP
jgi:tetratricopeptide (TPR) repeat protein